MTFKYILEQHAFRPSVNLCYHEIMRLVFPIASGAI